MKRFALFLLLTSIATANINAQDTDSITAIDNDGKYILIHG